MQNWYIIVKKGPLKNKKILLVDNNIVIGRTDENDITLDEQAVSRHHVKIENKNDVLWLTDLKSKNGSYLNKEKITTPVSYTHLTLPTNREV